MISEHGPPLDYASNASAAYKKLSAKQWALCFLFLLTLLIVARAIVFGPFTSAQVRLDTGDLRYRFYGIPIHYRPMPEPYRSALLRTAGRSTKLPARWEWIQFGGPHNPDSMCQHGYMYAACWESEDPTICRLAVEDMAEFARACHWNGGLPESCGVASGSLIDQTPAGTLAVKSGWKSDEAVQHYCRSKGYVIP